MAVWSEVRFADLAVGLRLDPEYYRPELRRLDRLIGGLRPKPFGELAGQFLVGPFGSAFNVENYIDESPYRYIRGQDVKPFFLQEGDNAHIPKSHFEQLSKYALRPFDLMISVVGTLGNCAIVPQDIGDAVFSCKSTVWRSKSADKDLPFYLVAYLNSRVGQAFLQRLPRGHIQTGLNLEDLRSIPVVEPGRLQIQQIADVVRRSQSQLRHAKELIAAAEGQLTDSLGLGTIDLSPQKCYSRPFRDLMAANRFGAEYFMPCKQRVLDALAKLPHQTVEVHAPAVREMWNPREATESVRNFDITAALEPFLDDSQEPQQPADIGSTKKRFRAGDLVVSRLRSYLKEIAVVRTSDGFPSVGSSEFIVLRPTGKGLSAETLMVFLRCPLVQTVLKWSQDGSNHPRFTEVDLLALPVPDAVLDVRKEIDRLVKSAMAARREASRLLAEAKQAVEDLITGKGA